jgi:hypothetical protein
MQMKALKFMPMAGTLTDDFFEGHFKRWFDDMKYMLIESKEIPPVVMLITSDDEGLYIAIESIQDICSGMHEFSPFIKGLEKALRGKLYAAGYAVEAWLKRPSDDKFDEFEKNYRPGDLAKAPAEEKEEHVMLAAETKTKRLFMTQRIRRRRQGDKEEIYFEGEPECYRNEEVVGRMTDFLYDISDMN